MPGLRKPMSAATRAVGRTYAAVLFGTDWRVGLLLLAMTLMRPASGVGGLLALAAANITALALGYRIDAVRAGLYGYNALLLGLAVLGGRGLDPTTAALVTLAGAGAALLTAVLGDALQRGLNLPVLVLPFVILGSLLTPALDTLGPRTAAVFLENRPLFDLTLPLPEPALALLRSFGALFFQSSPAAGLVVLGAALAVSRIGTVAMLVGVLTAALMMRVLHAGSVPGLAMTATYNGALAGLAVGAVLFVPSRASMIAAVGAAALAAWLSMTLSALFARLGLPLLAWPFVLVTLVTVRALHLRAPDRPPFGPVLPGLSPEANLDLAAMLRTRFGIPGLPVLALPVAGTWVVSQGVDGEHTHRGPWAHAWDFEIRDERGFPFRTDGTWTEDYLCFAAPVLAPGTGTVAAVHDGIADGKPGGLDVEQPWGNAVVIQHGPELFSVVAHLKLGSILVRAGEHVVTGQPIAACGASGRSPRPHVHLQAQRTPDLGAPAIPSRIVHYLLDSPPGGRRYVHSGVPREGEYVTRPSPSPIADAFSALPPGLEIVLDRPGGGPPIRLRSELTLLGERYLRDLDRGDRLYFTLAYGGLAFTTHAGPAGTPLRALFLALPRLPSVAGSTVALEDRPPPAALLPRPLRIVHDLIRFLVDPIETRAEVELRQEGEVLSVLTRAGVGLRGRVSWRYEGRVEIDPDGLRAIEVRDRRAPAAPIVKAWRRS